MSRYYVIINLLIFNQFLFILYWYIGVLLILAIIYQDFSITDLILSSVNVIYNYIDIITQRPNDAIKQCQGLCFKLKFETFFSTILYEIIATIILKVC